MELLTALGKKHCIALIVSIVCQEDTSNKVHCCNFYSPIAGALVNKYGCRPVSIAGSIVGAIGFAISYYASSNAYLFLSIGVLGG